MEGWKLLGCCVELAEQAGVVIRAVNAKRVISGHTALKGVLKEGGNVRSWATTADDEAQHLIVGELRRRFPGIKVIGEEEEAEMLPILGGLLWKKGGGRRGRWKVRVFKLFPHKLEYSTPAIYHDCDTEMGAIDDVQMRFLRGCWAGLAIGH